MKLLYFNIAVTAVYVASMGFLVRELQTVSAEERREHQTASLMFAFTLMYIVLIWETHVLAAMFAGG